jgi:acid stress chaperone HdeB
MGMKYHTGSLVGLMLAVMLASAGNAQVTVDIAKITCGQFLAYTIADPRDIALWLNGYYTGKRGGSTLIETQTLKANYDRIRRHCLVNQDMPVMQAVETLFGEQK